MRQDFIVNSPPFSYHIPHIVPPSLGSLLFRTHSLPSQSFVPRMSNPGAQDRRHHLRKAELRAKHFLLRVLYYRVYPRPHRRYHILKLTGRTVSVHAATGAFGPSSKSVLSNRTSGGCMRIFYWISTKQVQARIARLGTCITCLHRLLAGL